MNMFCLQRLDHINIQVASLPVTSLDSQAGGSFLYWSTVQFPFTFATEWLVMTYAIDLNTSN